MLHCPEFHVFNRFICPYYIFGTHTHLQLCTVQAVEVAYDTFTCY